MSDYPPSQIDISKLDWATPQTPAILTSTSESPSNRSQTTPRSECSSPSPSSQHSQFRKSTSGIFSESSSGHNSFQTATLPNVTRCATAKSSPLFQRKEKEDDQISVDPYKILGLEQDVNREDIRTAYRRLALLSHPRRSIIGTITPGSNYNTNHVSDSSLVVKEEDIRKWQFIAIAASYETLSIPEYRAEYDSIWRRTQLGFLRDPTKSKHKRGLWMRVRKGLDINNSFDVNTKEANHCCIPMCGTSARYSTITEEEGAKSKAKFVSQLQSTMGGKKLMEYKPRLLSEDRDRGQSRGKSSGAESAATEETNDDFARDETTYLFGGPLAPMFRARQYQPFSNAFELFQHEFGSDIFRSRSCFDDEDEEGSNPKSRPIDFAQNNFAQTWVSGGTGRLLEETNLNLSPPMPSKPRATEQKPSLVYPVLPDIPLLTLRSYGILDGRIKTLTQHSKPNKKSDLQTEVVREKKNGFYIETTTTTKIVGSIRIVRTQIVKVEESTSKKKTMTSVKKETIPQAELQQNAQENNNHAECFEIVPCCSYSSKVLLSPLPPPLSMSATRTTALSDDSTISSQSSFLSAKNFEEKRFLKRRMKKLFIKQQLESRQDAMDRSR